MLIWTYGLLEQNLSLGAEKLLNLKILTFHNFTPRNVYIYIYMDHRSYCIKTGSKERPPDKRVK